MAGRLTQLPVEVLLSPTDNKARLTQMPVEVLVSPNESKARLTSMPVEVLIGPPVPYRPLRTVMGSGLRNA